MKTVEEIYTKKELHQHILDRPDSYIGSTKETTEERFVYDTENKKIIKKIIEYNPGMIKIFDEILVNAIDQTVRESSTDIIKVSLDKSKNQISVFNNGPGIPVIKHKEYGIYIPELLFGNLLTSSNYDDTEKRIVGGMNGLGAKCANLFSKVFVIETVDAKNKLYYRQEFKNNMYTKGEPVIKPYNLKPFTRITFIPDSKRLGDLTDDTIDLLKKRVIDTTATTSKNVSVYLDGEKIKEKDFLSYISYYTENKFIHERFEKGDISWDIAVALNENYEQVSFVNGIDTYQGGKHVEYVSNQLIKKITSFMEEKKNTKDVKSSYIKDRIFLFVRATIINPNFTSQTKEYLSTNSKDFGISIQLSDKFINKFLKSGIIEEVMSFVNFKNEKALAKNTNTARKTRINIPKLDDANHAGSNKSKMCTLILTEGDSAKTFAISGLSIIGRDYYGVFPLRGKLLNVREATQQQLLKNEEINNLKKIIGLQHSKKYQNTDGLRYGKIMLLTDADVDGFHISGLVMNFFHVFWPELLEIPGFITTMKTPIMKAGKVDFFYSQNEYEKWKKTIPDISKWTIKYYKGLGTSTGSEAKELFKKLDKNKICYTSENKKSTDNAMLLAFEKKKADDRKIWLQSYKYNDDVDYSIQSITYDSFVNDYLVNFSLSDIIRSIPSIYDGFKPSQRKILYTLLKKDYKEEIKVAQLGGAVAEITAYHHGEASLYSTIVNMAQDYIGSNNINLLKPNGQFGCLDPETQILMYSGKIKKAKEIEIGDHLVGDDGFNRKVLRMVSGYDEMYRVTLNNGLTYTVNSKHILTFKVKCHKTIKWDRSRRMWTFVYFDKSVNKMKIDYIERSFDDIREEMELVNVKIYVYRNYNHIKDDDIVDINILDYLKIDDFTKQFLTGLTNNKKLLFSDINLNGSFQTGFNMRSPKEIMMASITSRYDYIHGVFEKNKRNIKMFINTLIISLDTTKEIIDGIIFIINSLGCSCYISSVEDTVYNLIIKGENINCLIKEKLKNNNSHYFKIDIKPIGRGPFVGWQVNRNNRFLLGNFVVTHNSRLQNGKDAASPRYIFTQLSDITKSIFHKTDLKIVNYINQDGQMIEPDYYVPVIPMILVNGCQGIGTGFSTFIPPYNPKDIIENMKCYSKGTPYKKMIPWYRNFKGKIVETDNPFSYISYGVYKKITEKKIKITELPIGFATEDYIEFIKNTIDNGTDIIKDHINNSTDDLVDIDILFNDANLVKESDFVYKFLRLTKTINISNMHLFNKDSKIQKYNNVYGILSEFLQTRLKYNKKRKDYIISGYTEDLILITSKIKFIELVINDKIKIYRKTKKEIIDQIIKNEIKKINNSYDYLLELPIYTFSLEKIKELNDRKDKITKELNIINLKTTKDILLEDLQKIEEKL